MISSNPNSLRHTSRKIKTFFLIVSLLIIGFGMAAVAYLLQKSQDVRQQASIEGGLVTVVPVLPTVRVGEPATITFTVNTQNAQIDGVQLAFTVETDTIESLDVQPISASGLQIVAKTITPVSNGFEVRMISIAQVGQAFSSNTPIGFATLSFTPTKVGTIQMQFDQTHSLATAYKSNPIRDELNTMQNLSFAVEGNAAATPTPTPTTNPTATPIATATPTPTPISTTPTPSPTPTATPNSGVGGDTGALCGASCSTNSQCARDLTCYNGVCRLATNPTSTSCAGQPDNGIARSCNEYCADTNECQSGLSCYFNRCRLPQNVSSTTCAAAISQTPNTPVPTAYTYSTSEENGENPVEENLDSVPEEYAEDIQEFEPVYETDIIASPLVAEQPETDDTVSPYSFPFFILGAGLGVSLLILLIAFIVIRNSHKMVAARPISSPLEKQPTIITPASKDLSSFAGTPPTPKDIQSDIDEDFKHELK